jgi:DNA-binding SARP family transcriptional activator
LTVWVRVLGTSQVVLDGPGAVAELGARKPRSVLAALALRLGSDLSPAALVELVWGSTPPRGALGTLHSYVSGVRRILEPGLGPRQRPSVLLTSDHGYRLDLRHDQVDAHHFADEVRVRHRALAPLASQFTSGPSAGWPDRAAISDHVDRLEELLALWTGDAYADLPEHPEVTVERAALDQLRLNAEEDRVLGLLALGDHAVVVAATEQAITRHPLQERVWALHALALARSGRQAEALGALRHVRGVLADELGLDPGQELRELEQALLVQDPALQQWLRPVVAAAGGTETVGPAATGLGAGADTGPDRGSPSGSHPGRPLSWGTFGRDREEAELLQVLLRARAGDPACALLVGEPGIGKSRLVERLSELAARHGFVVATGRCAQDDGAPPLWPWSQALGGLAHADGQPLDPAIDHLLAGVGPESPGGNPGGDTDSAERQAFRAWEGIAHAVLARSEASPLLLVLEDLHWADTASLRVLRRLLASTGPGHRLALLATRRPWPEPTGALAEVGEQLARDHVVRLDLHGLSLAEARALVADVVGTPVAEHVVQQWHARSEGNPFFLIELARLGDLGDGPSGADPAAAVPATVRDVILRRVGALPEGTRSLLLLAAVLGRRCSLDLLAAVAGEPVDVVDDLLVPAREAGLVQEPEAGTVAFTHALTRDAVAATTSPSRLARLHARAAHALEDPGVATGLVGAEEQIAELARHWLAAGPSHVSRAWRAATRAAEQARRTFSWVEAEQLMAAAIRAHRRDPLGTAEERIDLLLTRAADCRPNAEWDQVLPCAAEAISLARGVGDLARLADAAAAATDNAVWLPQQWYEVPDDTIEDLRWALGQLAGTDSPERCRVMLCLAVLLYYDPGATAEVTALAEEGRAMARRIGDPALLWWASHNAWKALWSPAWADTRLELARDGLGAARAAGDLDSEAVALVLLTGTVLELGDRARYEELHAETTRLARRRRNSYVLMALDWLELSLASMRADDEAVERLVEELYELRPRLNPGNEALHLVGIQLVSGMWDDRIGEIIEPMSQAMEVAQNDLAWDVLILALARTDDVPRLARELPRTVEHRVQNWSSTATWCCLAEAAAVAGDELLARQMTARLEPLAGRIAVSGISSVFGPVDGYLALGLAASGRHEEAVRAAERALAQAADWRLTAYAAWLRARREQLGF